MTLAEIAAELDVDERTIRRIEAAIAARLRAAYLEIGVTIDDVDPDFFSTVIRGFFSVPRRFLESRDLQIDRVSHDDTGRPVPASPGNSTPQSFGVGRRARRSIPRRFPTRKP